MMNNRDQLEAQAEKMQTELDKLKEQIKEMPEENSRWKPRLYGRYYVIEADGKIALRNNHTSSTMESAYAIGNCFESAEEAELHKLRLESMASRGSLPTDGEVGYFWHLTEQIVGYGTVGVKPGLKTGYLTGNLFKTAAEAQAWGEKYAKAWEALLN